ncbi:hypothetical protein KUTeg_022813 [Tegillarca granosa]|uniref:Uncharacterized protein n=1 Tax=Tegillarca granosa TaxID=220873 RepID=A0ABQ9E643_TEGGR|nr:hypothetical protein KUTeg_022813 [Tegillarca granosa]
MKIVVLCLCDGKPGVCVIQLKTLFFGSVIIDKYSRVVSLYIYHMSSIFVELYFFVSKDIF